MVIIIIIIITIIITIIIIIIITWCASSSSVTLLSPRLRAARTARARPSASSSWQLRRVTSFRCIGLDTNKVKDMKTHS